MAVRRNGRLAEQMPLVGGHRFTFSGQPPLVFKVVFVLLFVNTFAGFTLGILRHLKPGGFLNFPPCSELAANGVPYQVRAIICWFEPVGFL
jgi:hypothetical protein